MNAWEAFVERWKNCTRCPLHQQRFRICLARGVIPADMVIIGEAPGASEDAMGLPFVGPAGRVLDQIVERALPPAVSWVMTNLVCCYPRDAKMEGTNEPEAEEIQACHQRLVEFVNIARPRLIVCVGNLASQWVDWQGGVKCTHITHPAAILRMPVAQQQMAVQRCVITMRSAVEDMLKSPKQPFTNWGNPNAYQQTNGSARSRLREQLDRAYNEPDIPF